MIFSRIFQGAVEMLSSSVIHMAMYDITKGDPDSVSSEHRSQRANVKARGVQVMVSGSNSDMERTEQAWVHPVSQYLSTQPLLLAKQSGDPH